MDKSSLQTADSTAAEAGGKNGRWFVPAIFALTLFLSAGLLFVVEPMIAKMILPLLGGTPAVWNTCMMFFQALLLAGYLYAHLSGSRLRFRHQVLLHAFLLLSACIFLPVAVSRQLARSAEASPAAVVLVLLLVSVGMPFFVLSGSAPLLQKWFVRTGHHSAKDPYFLYSASNIGSMLALISYPSLIEPRLPLKEQSILWAAAYGILIALMLICSFFAWRARKTIETVHLSAGSPPIANYVEMPAQPSQLDRLSWIALSFVPSSLMLGVTTFLSTDIAAIPLFWVIPLMLYLLSFILVFANLPSLIHRITLRLAPAALIAILFVNIPMTKPAIGIIFLSNLIVFFIIAMACHGELARSRPSARHLTEFYLCMSIGGVAGGIFNALAAPLIFRSIAEYPIACGLAAFLIPLSYNDKQRQPVRPKAGMALLLDLALPVLLGILTFWLIEEWPLWNLQLNFLNNFSEDAVDRLKVIITYAIPASLCFCLVFTKRRLRFGLGFAALVLAIMINNEWKEDIVHKERSFFGVIKVSNDADHEYRVLVHGTTQHGKQSLDPLRAAEPLTYYHRKGPVGQIFRALNSASRKDNVALIGLGTGTLASYGEPHQHFTFYEIDPAIKRIATDPAMFTYMKLCRADWDIIIGDARLKLEEAADGRYGLMIIDAFSSDAIPVHLLTREALHLYFSKLENNGVLAVHISNKYLDLEPVLQRLAADAGLEARSQDDNSESTNGKYRSHWIVLARKEADLGRLAYDQRWEKLRNNPNVPLWTDDFSNLLSIFKWR